MKKLLIALLSLTIALTPAAVLAYKGNTRAERVESMRQEIVLEMKKQGHKTDVLIQDDGKSMDLGEGSGPVVIIQLPGLQRECLVALHPKEAMIAILGCVDVTEI